MTGESAKRGPKPGAEHADLSLVGAARGVGRGAVVEIEGGQLALESVIAPGVEALGERAGEELGNEGEHGLRHKLVGKRRTRIDKEVRTWRAAHVS